MSDSDININELCITLCGAELIELKYAFIYHHMNKLFKNI